MTERLALDGGKPVRDAFLPYGRQWLGPEEEKLGIHGASTCPVLLDGAIVPAGSVLGEIGKGHRVALNILNVGRLKLAASCLGAMRPAMSGALAYARERVAFGRPIVRLPLIAAKLAGMAARAYATESVVYRVAGLVDERLAGAEQTAEATRAALEEYAVECSVAKVLASEDLDWIVDQLVQIHGGYGYIESYPAARAYRDARINRIWEGTSEINRLLVPGTLLRRAMAGRLDLLGAARRAQDALLAPSGAGPELPGTVGGLVAERALVDGLRQSILLLAGAAVQRFGTGLEDQQELLAGVADLAIAHLAADSAIVRAEQAAVDADPGRAVTHADLARLVVADRLGAAETLARSLAASVAEGDEARVLAAGIRRMLRGEPVDRVALSRRVSERVVEAGGSPV